MEPPGNSFLPWNGPSILIQRMVMIMILPAHSCSVSHEGVRLGDGMGGRATGAGNTGGGAGGAKGAVADPPPLPHEATLAAQRSWKRKVRKEERKRRSNQ